ncbi:cobalt ABC transporter permease [Amorphus sp. 3PC139-8]|uniref:cobalt ABC transporter permease n=1 Tax=Amorphus sp. 3PC139-8 TaxID=2735676 RepID=UPI00345DEBD1
MRLLQAFVLLLMLVPAAPASAHNVIASVFTSGDAIEGEIGFSNGEMAPDALVEVFDEDGNKLGETRTGADGFFTYVPTKKVPHIFRSNLGAGHVAEVRMEVDELPPIDGEEGEAPASTSATASTGSTPTAPSSDAGQMVAAGIDLAAFQEEQRRMITEAVQKQVIPLRRDLAAYKEKADLQGVLGGIGYILGLFGVGYYIAARRKLQRS